MKRPLRNKPIGFLMIVARNKHPLCAKLKLTNPYAYDRMRFRTIQELKCRGITEKF